MSRIQCKPAVGRVHYGLSKDNRKNNKLLCSRFILNFDIYIYLYLYIYLFIYLFICALVCTCTHTQTQTYRHTYIPIFAFIFIHIYIYIHTRIYIYIYYSFARARIQQLLVTSSRVKNHVAGCGAVEASFWVGGHQPFHDLQAGELQ